MSMSIVHTSIAAALLSVGAISAASANPVPTLGDPFPTGSIVSLTGGPFATGFGSFDSITLSNFGTPAESGTPGNTTYLYADHANGGPAGQTGPTFTISFFPPTNPAGMTVAPTTVFTNGVFEVNVQNTMITGAFPATLLEATFSGTILGHSVSALIDPGSVSSGTATYTLGGPTGLQVSTLFNVAGGFTVDCTPGSVGCVFNSTPLIGNSNPALSAVPLPGSIVLLGSALAGLGGLMRRRRSSQQAVAAA